MVGVAVKFIARTPDDLPRIGQAIRKQLEAGPVAVTYEPAKSTRSLEQNAKLHAMLGDIARQRQWGGQWLDIEDWKRLFVSAWCRANKESVRLMPALDGHGMDVIYRRTSKLSVTEMIDLIEFVTWWAVENDVRLAA